MDPQRGGLHDAEHREHVLPRLVVEHREHGECDQGDAPGDPRRSERLIANRLRAFVVALVALERRRVLVLLGCLEDLFLGLHANRLQTEMLSELDTLRMNHLCGCVKSS